MIIRLYKYYNTSFTKLNKTISLISLKASPKKKHFLVIYFLSHIIFKTLCLWALRSFFVGLFCFRHTTLYLVVICYFQDHLSSLGKEKKERINKTNTKINVLHLLHLLPLVLGNDVQYLLITSDRLLLAWPQALLANILFFNCNNNILTMNYRFPITSVPKPNVPFPYHTQHILI